jgi:hypothetical protein
MVAPKKPREAAVAVALLDDGDEFVFDEGAGVGANEKFVFGEQGIELDEIYALIFECHRLVILVQKGRCSLVDCDE